MEMLIEGETHPKELENIEEGNIRDGDIWVNLNESRNDNQSELLQTVKEKHNYKVLRKIMNAF